MKGFDLHNRQWPRAISPEAGIYFRRVSAVVAGVAFVLAFVMPRFAQAERGSATTGKMEIFHLQTSLLRPFRHDGSKRGVIVYTPAAYYDAMNADQRFPVVYLLHGSPGNPMNFIRYGDFPSRLEKAIQAGSVEPTIFVIPDGNYAGEKHGDGEWADSADHRDRFETWLLKEIVPWTDARYRTQADPAGRFVSGVSEGGFGSVNLTLRNPKVFGGAIGLSGYYDMRGFGWGHITFNDSDVLMSLNSPLFYVPDRLSSGRVPPEWKGLKIFLGAGAEEKPYADHTRRLGDALKAAGVRTVIVATPEGKHDWNLWSNLFFEALNNFLPPPPPIRAAPQPPRNNDAVKG